MYHLTEAYLLATFISLLAAGWGALVLGASLVPSILRRSLNADLAAPVLAGYWPSLLKAAMTLGLAATAVITICAPLSALPNLYALLLSTLAGFMTACFFVAWLGTQRAPLSTPKPQRLGAIGLVLGLVVALLLIAALIYVLPGQFTFWPTAG